MQTVISIALLLGIAFVMQYLCELIIGRLNRKTAAIFVEVLTTEIELSQLVIHVVEDLRRIDPERDEILEVIGLQLASYVESAKDQQGVMTRISTRQPFWFYIVPISVVAARGLRRLPAGRQRNKWLEEHLHEEDGTSGDVDAE